MARRRAGAAAALARVLAGGVLAGGAPAVAVSDPPTTGEEHPPSFVFFTSPSDLEPAYGDVVVEVDVLADDVTEVVISVDGEELGRLTAPPYRLTAELGDDYGAHRFEVVVLGERGELARAGRETPALRVDDEIDLELQQLYVTVGQTDRATPSLDAGDFQVMDNGVAQTVVTFERGDAALAVALLVDASESMRGGRLEAALEGARSFLRGMQRLDEAAVYLFSDAVQLRSPFSQEPAEIEGLLGEVRAGGGTALNDALYLAIRDLEGRQGRRVVVLLSDGVDIHSVLGVSDLLWSARRSRSLVYWIELAERAGEVGALSPWRDIDEHAAELAGLRRLVDESGGRVVRIERVEEAAAAFAEILDELRRQYILGYYPTVNIGDGRWHEVDVRVGRPGLRVRTRGGYVDY